MGKDGSQLHNYPIFWFLLTITISSYSRRYYNDSSSIFLQTDCRCIWQPQLFFAQKFPYNSTMKTVLTNIGGVLGQGGGKNRSLRYNKDKRTYASLIGLKKPVVWKKSTLVRVCGFCCCSKVHCKKDAVVKSKISSFLFF